MPRRLLKFQNHLPYLIFHQGLTGMAVFKEEDDRYRLIYHLYSANFGAPADLSVKNIRKVAEALLNGGDIRHKIIAKPHPPLTYILGFSITPTYLCLILSPRIQNGISKYTQRVFTGYAKYYNAKYSRKGPVFNGRFRAFSLGRVNLLDPAIYFANELCQVQDFKNVEAQVLKNIAVSSKWCSYKDALGDRGCHLLAPYQFLQRYCKPITYGNKTKNG